MSDNGVLDIPSMNDYKSDWKVLEKRNWKEHPDVGGDSLFYTAGYLNAQIMGKELGFNRPHRFVNAQITHEDARQAFFSQNGYWTRHPDQNRWSGEINRGSRDQLTGGLIFLALAGFGSVLFKLFLKHLVFRCLLFTTNTRRNGCTKENHGEPLSPWKNLKLTKFEQFVVQKKIPVIPINPEFRNYNWKLPDLTLFETWSLYARALPWGLGWLFYPLLLINDLILLYDTSNQNDPDVMNHVQQCVFARLRYSTFISKYIFTKRSDWNGICMKLRAYSENDEPAPFGSPPLFKLWNPIIKELCRR